MTRDRSPGEWAVGALAVLAAAAALVGLLVWSRWALLVALTLTGTHAAAWRIPNRGLRAELAAAHDIHASWDSGLVRDELAESGPITPPGGNGDLEPEPWVSAGYRRPACRCDDLGSLLCPVHALVGVHMD